MTTTAQYVAALRTRQRAVRHATSLPLLTTALGMGFLTYCEVATDWWTFPQALVPAITFAVLLVGMLVQRQVLGVGTGNDRYGLIALALLAALVLPFGLVTFFFVGAGFFLGVGLVVLGWRARDPWLWGAGLALMALSPLITLGTLDNHAAFLGGGTGGLVISTIGLLVLSAVTFGRERRTVLVDIP